MVVYFAFINKIDQPWLSKTLSQKTKIRQKLNADVASSKGNKGGGS